MTWHLHATDCLGPDGMATLADGSVDHVICDPPYEVEAHTQQRRTKETFGTQIGGGDTRGAATKAVDFEPITEDQRNEAAYHIVRVARRWIVVFCQAEAVGKWRDSLVAAGATWKRSGIWVKPDGQPQLTGDRPGMGYESLAIAWASDCRSAWNGGGKHGVWSCSTKSDPDSERTGHVTQKPARLMESLVTDFTNRGETILDPFAGSGTTGVACIRLGRNFIGYERDPKYAEIARKRLDATREQTDLFESRRKKAGKTIDMFKKQTS